MSMMDLYTQEEAIQAIEEARATKKALMDEVEKLNNMIFLLQYFLATGEAIDPMIYGIEPDEEDLNDG